MGQIDIYENNIAQELNLKKLNQKKMNTGNYNKSDLNTGNFINSFRIEK